MILKRTPINFRIVNARLFVQISNPSGMTGVHNEIHSFRSYCICFGDRQLVRLWFVAPGFTVAGINKDIVTSITGFIPVLSQRDSANVSLVREGSGSLVPLTGSAPGYLSYTCYGQAEKKIDRPTEIATVYHIT
jgi:hypothetical protein